MPPSLAHLSAVVREVKESPDPDVSCDNEREARASNRAWEGTARQSPNPAPLQRERRQADGAHVATGRACAEAAPRTYDRRARSA